MAGSTSTSAWGLCRKFLTADILHDLVGNMAVGHTRYSTTGSSHIRNAQPLTVDCKRGQIAIAHNGNLTNASHLRDELESKGLVFQTTVDSEIILICSRNRRSAVRKTMSSRPSAVWKARTRWCIMTERELIGVRDPHGFRPLSIGKVERRVGAGK